MLSSWRCFRSEFTTTTSTAHVLAMGFALQMRNEIKGDRRTTDGHSNCPSVPTSGSYSSSSVMHLVQGWPSLYVSSHLIWKWFHFKLIIQRGPDDDKIASLTSVSLSLLSLQTSNVYPRVHHRHGVSRGHLCCCWRFRWARDIDQLWRGNQFLLGGFLLVFIPSSSLNV